MAETGGTLYSPALMLTLLAFVALAPAADLAVSSNVRGLSIVVNGVDTGLRTPATVSGLRAGSATVLVGDACRAGEAEVRVEEGRTVAVNVRAEEQLATLTVEVRPSQAVVEVNDGQVRLSPNVPVGLPCGTYEVRASLKGYATSFTTLELIGGQELDLPIQLDRLGMSSMEISVEPRSAAILFDGRDVGRDAASLPTVLEGAHRLGAELKGYEATEAEIQVRGGDNLVFTIVLVRRGDGTSAVRAVGRAATAALEEGGAAAKEPEIELDPDLVPEPTRVENDDSLEPDADLAPVQSWSERHAAAKAQTAAARVTSTPKGGRKAAGGVLIGLGALVGGAGGYYTYSEAAAAYNIWSGKQDAADAASSAQRQLRQSQADAYWTEEFAPKGNLMYGTFAAGGLLAATGVLLFVIDAGPFVVPSPGGGVVGWSGSF